MTRFIRILLSAAAFAAFTLNIANAQAGPATVTFNDPNCASWGVSQNGSAFTLTCQTLLCSISADKPTPQPTDNVLLTATCVGFTGSTYTWSKFSGPGNCPAIASTTSTASLANIGAGNTALGCIYKVAATDVSNGSGSANITLNWTTAPAQSPSGCHVTFSAGSASLPSTGGSITMVGSCTGNVDANTTYAWTKSGNAFVSGTTAADTLAANTGSSAINWTYVFTATNAGAAPTNTTQVVSVAGTGGGGGSMDLTGCTSQGYTGRGLDMAFPATGNVSVANGALNSSPSGSFGNGDALVVRFTTPAAGVNNVSVFQPAGNAPYQNTVRVYTVATSPCVFASTNISFPPSSPYVYSTVSQSPAITMNIGTCPYAGTIPAICTTLGAWLQPNTVYYVNMVNRNGYGGSNSCAGSNCDMRIDFNN